MRTGRSELIRDLNRALVLDIVRDRRAVSRAEIARIAGLSPSTVTSITSSLISDELLVEEEPQVSRRGSGGSVGRPGTLLRVDSTARHVIGVKLAPESLTATVTDLDATPLAMVRLPHGVHARPSQVGDLFEHAIEQVLREADLSATTPLGIGIGVPGVVDPGSGRVSDSPLPEWAGSDLTETLEERLGIPVLVDNDVNTLTIAESLFGAGKGLAHLLVVTVGRGIGMGVVVDGAVVRGWRGALGEIGHTRVVSSDRPCWCGRVGCLESVAAEPAMVRDVSASVGADIGPDSLAAAAEADARVADVLVRAGHLIGAAIATAAMLLDPQRVIISGEGVRLGPRYLDGIRNGIRNGIRGRLGTEDELDLVIEPWGDEAWARGAASLVLRELFHPAHLRDDGLQSGSPITSRGNPQQLVAAGGQGGTRT